MLNSLLRRFVVCLVVCIHAATARGDERGLEFKRPELVAIMWAPQDSPIQFRKTPEAAWRSDGTSIPAEELQWLFESRNLLISQVSAGGSRTLRPLVVVFKVDERAQRPPRLDATALIDDMPVSVRDPLFELRPATSTKDHLFTARIAPPPLAAWPANIKLDLRTQVAEPTVLHVLDAARAKDCTPEKPLQVDRGVTWRIGPNPRPRNEEHERPFAVLRVDQNVADPACDWTAEGTLKNGSPLKVRQITRSRNVLEYACELPDDSAITQVELQRRQYRTERYEQVPVRSDLLPK